MKTTPLLLSVLALTAFAEEGKPSKALPLAAAQELLAQGFLEEVLAKVGHAEAAEAVRGMLREKFHQA